MRRARAFNELGGTGVGSGADHELNAMTPRQETLDQKDGIPAVRRIQGSGVKAGAEHLAALKEITYGDIAEKADDDAIMLRHPSDGPMGKLLEHGVADPEMLPFLAGTGIQTIANAQRLDLVVIA